MLNNNTTLNQIMDAMPIGVHAYIRHAFNLGYKAGKLDAAKEVSNARWRMNSNNANIMMNIKEAGDNVNGKPTYGVAALIGLDVSEGKYCPNAVMLRQTLKDAGFTQRMGRYKGAMVKAWFNYPPLYKVQKIYNTQPTQPAPDEEDLPL